MDYNTNCDKFNLEYVSNSISFKFQEVGKFFEIFWAYYFTFYSGFNTRITVAKETSELYAMPIPIPSKRYNEDLPNSVEVEFVDRFRGLSWCVRFVLRRHLWNDSEIPWQHFRWHYKQSNIENTIKFLLTTLWYNVVIE